MASQRSIGALARHLAGAALLFAVSASCASAQTQTPAPNVREMLQAFADDYRVDPMATTADFGIKIGDEWWNVSVHRTQQASRRGRLTDHTFGPHEVVLRQGPPTEPTWYFDLADRSVLERIYRNEMTAATGAMQTYDADSVAVEERVMQGFADNAGSEAQRQHTLTHFWARGLPEIVYFGRDQALPTHGASAVGLHTYKGNRIGWFSLGRAETANAAEELQSSQIPNLIIITRGRGRARLAGQDIELREGMSVFIAPHVQHTFFNPYDEPLEGVLVLFGDNTDAAFGRSYMDIQEAFRGFYGDYLAQPDPLAP
jgi:hypothetical protein